MFLNIAKHGKIATKIQLAKTGVIPEYYRKLCQFINVQYCTKDLALLRCVYMPEQYLFSSASL